MSAEADTTRWLVSPPGSDAIGVAHAIIGAADDQATGVVRATGRLRASGLTAEQSRAACDAAITRVRAQRRWHCADQLVASTDALAQASDPAVAAWRATRIDGTALVLDVCAGLGADVIAASLRNGNAHAVDIDESRLILLDALAAVHGASVTTQLGDAATALRHVTANHHVIADPSRRRDGRRRLQLSQLEPSIDVVRSGIARAASGAIILPPGIDLAEPLLADGELEFIQYGNQLLEAVLWLGASRSPDITATATRIAPSGPSVLSAPPREVVTRSRAGIDEDVTVGPIGHVLLDFAPALVRARLHRAIAHELGASRISRNRALMTLPDRPPPSPWYIARDIEAVLPYRSKHVREWLREADPLPIEIAVHGVDMPPEGFWHKIGRPTRGPAGRRIELIRTEDGVIVLATRTIT